MLLSLLRVFFASQPHKILLDHIVLEDLHVKHAFVVQFHKKEILSLYNNMISSTCIVPTVFSCLKLYAAVLCQERRRVTSNRERCSALFFGGGECLPPLPSNSVIIILSNYILLSSLPGGRRRSSPLPADDREAILEACDQRHNDILQRLQRRAVFQQ